MPYAGGWFEQPLALLVQLMALETAQRAIETMDRDSKSEEEPVKGFAALSADQETLYTWLMSM